MKLKATNYAMMMYGLEDYNHRIGTPIEFVEANDNSLDIAPGTLLYDFIKYIEYCESFGYVVSLTANECHIANE